MAIRFEDVPCYTFSFWSDMVVVCPKCGKAGIVRFDRERGMAFFQCESCCTKKETSVDGNHASTVTAKCTSTGKYFQAFVPDAKIHGQKVRVKCRYCKESVIGDVLDDKEKKYMVFQDMRRAEEPYFCYPLYFQASYRGKTVWALNREHLQYLIDYLTADIRTLPPNFYENYGTMRSQSDALPAFMKAAKNRDGIVKLLTKLQAK